MTNPFDLIDTLRGLHQDSVAEIMEEYKDRAEVEMENKRLLTICERYFAKMNYKYTISTLYKCFYWYLYYKANRVK